MFLLYREIYLYWNAFNRIHSSILAHHMMSASLCQITTTIILIMTCGGSANFATENGTRVATITFSLLILINCFIAILCIASGGASVHTTSKKSIRSLKVYQGSNDLLKGKLISKIVRTLLEIKTKMGMSNFIDRMTPLVIQNFDWNRNVDILLIKLRWNWNRDFYNIKYSFQPTAIIVNEDFIKFSFVFEIL